MSRIMHLVAEAVATFAAAAEAAAAIEAHRMPPARALRRLGIPAHEMRALRH